MQALKVISDCHKAIEVELSPQLLKFLLTQKFSTEPLNLQIRESFFQHNIA